jgi:thioredoxin-dependent peroxiredoxin
LNEVIAMLKPGDKAPDFRVKSDEGKDISLADYRGKRVLLYFFPKANTSG